MTKKHNRRQKSTQKYNHRQKLSLENMYMIACIIGSVATFFSVIIVLLTLLEMQQDRNTAYAPDLVIGNTKLEMKWDDTGELNSDIDEGEISNLDITINNEGRFINQNPVLKIYNIGAGNAKKLSVKLDMKNDLPKIVKYINSFDGVEASINKQKDYYLLDFINNDKILNVVYMLDNVLLESDFLLSSGQQYHELSLPMIYEILEYTGIFKDSEPVNFPSLNLLISYYDIQGKKYSKRIQINVSCVRKVLFGNGSGRCLFHIKANPI